MAICIMVIFGSVLIADWQSIGSDLCQIFSTYPSESTSHNTSVSCEDIDSPSLHSYCMELITATEDDNWTAQASELCLATEGCRWNQFSVLTNSLCINCPAICRSVSFSLSLIQFSVGAVLFVASIPMSDSCLWIIVTNNLKDYEQVHLQ